SANEAPRLERLGDEPQAGVSGRDPAAPEHCPRLGTGHGWGLRPDGDVVRLGKRIVVIPDTQVRPGEPTHHMAWIGQAIADYQPDEVVHLWDHWDMPSLSQWTGSLGKEGLRY